ncbi:MAG: type II toxin-antitoxin system CcdA family antitoxin [Candidatus Binatia bacterium]
MTGNSKSPKRSTNLSVREDLLVRARELGVNLSATLDAALVEAIRVEGRRRWVEENRAAIASYNDRFDETPEFSAGLRGF